MKTSSRKAKKSPSRRAGGRIRQRVMRRERLAGRGNRRRASTSTVEARQVQEAFEGGFPRPGTEDEGGVL